MANDYFQFKQFTIRHDRCAMKVGTDGVLLGAWTPLDGVRTALDVGTGTGLIALQLAQRSAAVQVIGVEIDAEAALQAQENVDAAPWNGRVQVVCSDIKEYRPVDKRFDLVVSNPPYFVEALKCPNSQRNAARHAGEDTLSFDTLFSVSKTLLNEGGRVAVVIPVEVEQALLSAAVKHGFFPTRLLRVFTKPGKPVRRLLFCFAQQASACIEESLCIEHEHHQYTPEYISLTRDFYLKM